MKAVMAQLEAGVSDVFQSGQYKNYLGTMSKFHHYSFNNIAYVVSQHFGLDTSEYSFGYIAAWSHGKELPELRTSLSVIQAASAELINSIEGKGLERSKAPPRRHTPKRKPTQPIR